jgi:hypothetical protein
LATVLAPERPAPPVAAKEGRLRKALLLCGIVSGLYHAALNVYVPTQWDGYSVLSQAVSELSAIGAPTRTLWIALSVPYTLMVIAFGFGVLMAAAGSRALRVVGALFVFQGVVGAFWPPMHARGAVTTLTDTLHIVWTAGWLLTMLTAMGFAAAALGRRFRLYTLATVAVFVAFGALTSFQAARLAADLPTPFLGLWERVNMGAGILWVAVLATVLLRAVSRRSSQSTRPW